LVFLYVLILKKVLCRLNLLTKPFSPLLQPADVVKTRMQTSSMTGLSRAVRTLYSEAGVTAFTAGLAPRMLRRTVMAALAWTVYERINTTLSLK